MFDYAAPKEFPPTSAQLGVGQHPHRGFETVTIAFQGEVEHADSVGNRDVIGAGDVQWMTAGRGIIHEEFHSRKFAKSGGVFEMCQLWLNLPKKHKMHAPRYQPILSKDIPTITVSDNGTTARIIAGSLKGENGPAKTFSPVELWDVNIPSKGGDFETTVPGGHNFVVFVRKGGIIVGDTKLGPQDATILTPTDLSSKDGNILTFAATKDNSSVLVIGGEPIDEPIAARGPFVMNTNDELTEAWQDYYSGKMGR